MRKDVNTNMAKRIEQTVDALRNHKSMQKGLDVIRQIHESTIKTQIAITEIPAPPYKEQTRAYYFKKRLEDLGLHNVTMDEEGNVLGLYPGSGNNKKLLVTAHLDTVFPEGTDTTVRKEDGLLYAPGISDDTRGLAEVLAIVEAMKKTEIQPAADILFGGTVGEEGTGDLRGVKHIFDSRDDIDSFISIDGSPSNQITYQGTGSYRYNVTYQGPGGHSFADFGQPSPIHAMGRAIHKLADLETRAEPKTTFSVGMADGGTSINAIAEKASMKVDLRSNDKNALNQLDVQFSEMVQASVSEENNRWDSKLLCVDCEKIGDRPPAQQSQHSIIVQTICSAHEGMGMEAKLAGPGSTDANYPMSLGIPSVALGIGGNAGGVHTDEEWYDPQGAWMAVQKNFMSVMALAGMKGTIAPMMEMNE